MVNSGERVTYQNIGTIHNDTERYFAGTALALGLNVWYEPERVPDDGNKYTIPDFLVNGYFDGATRSLLVEVTKGLTDTPAKNKQLRKVERAGIQHYVQFGGDEIYSPGFPRQLMQTLARRGI